jgi:hypothetical protein
MDESLKVLAQQLGEEEERMKEDLCIGRAKDFAHYQHACGVIQGFHVAQGLIATLARNQMEDGDDE